MRKVNVYKYNDKFTDPQRNYARIPHIYLVINFFCFSSVFPFHWLISFFVYACMNLGTTPIFAFHVCFFCSPALHVLIEV